MFNLLVDMEDKSVYTDKLETLTGKPRSYWGRFSLRMVQQIYRKEIRKRQTNACARQFYDRVSEEGK